jgi:hypothetical protein
MLKALSYWQQVSFNARYVFLAFFNSMTSQAAVMMTASNAFLHAFLVAGLIIVAIAAVCCLVQQGNDDAMIRDHLQTDKTNKAVPRNGIDRAAVAFRCMNYIFTGNIFTNESMFCH